MINPVLKSVNKGYKRIKDFAHSSLERQPFEKVICNISAVLYHINPEVSFDLIKLVSN
jgi:hypothetical protein